MKWFCAGVAFVTFSTICGLLLGIIAAGLNPLIAGAAIVFGFAIAAHVIASGRIVDDRLQAEKQAAPADERVAPVKYRNAWKWVLAACFAIFALRSFGWLIYIDGEEWRVQSPNNLGDLALHITMIRNFADGVRLWPESPIYVFSHLRYPAGVDLFNSLFAILHVDLIRVLIWTGLLASIATFYAFYRWGGTFAVAGFLFNGGIIGLQKFIESWQFADYQGDKSIAWKSIPLSMFVPQRSVLYAIPVGVLLLWHWREKFFRRTGKQGPLPFWIELTLYASMPLFHVHTFLALSLVLASLFLIEFGYELPTLTRCFRTEGPKSVTSLVREQRWTEVFGQTQIRAHALKLVALAIVPATFFLWLVTDFFHASSVVEWHPAWVQTDEDFKRPFFQFWFLNFGFLVPLLITLIGFCAWSAWQNRRDAKVPEDIAFLGSAAVIFLVAFCFKLAPWGWDNIKLLMWGYFIVLPLLWIYLIAEWPLIARAIACIVLFGSGFVTLIGGLGAGRPGYGFANRGEVDGVGEAVKTLPVEARFAAYPTYNHPLLLQGRKLVLGYPGHLWTEGFDYAEPERQLRQLMQGANDWRDMARVLRVRFLFWGREETANYPGSARPWQQAAPRVAAGNWGEIYDLSETPAVPHRPH
jgi:hypothetical protein